MANRTSGLQVTIAGDAKGLQRAVADADKSLGRLSKSADDTGQKTKKSFGGIGSAAKVGFGAVATGAAVGGAAVLGFAKVSVDSAKDVAESLTKNQVLFGSYAKSVEQFASSSATAFGISKRAALEYTGVFGNLSRAIGISKKDSAEMSIRLTKLAADLASFNNTSVEDALEALQSGLVGETEPLRKYGVTLSANAVAAEAMRAGIVKVSRTTFEYRSAVFGAEKAMDAYNKTVKEHGRNSLEARGASLALERANQAVAKAAKGGKVELTAQQKALASVALITRQTKNAQGDFARTSAGAANQQRILTARVEDLKTKVGTALLPVLTKAVTGVNKFATEMEHGTGAGGSFARSMSGLSRSLKPYTTATGDAVEASKKHKTIMTALGEVIPNPMRSVRFFTNALNGLKKASDAVVTAVKAVGSALKWTGNAAKDAGGFLKDVAGSMNPIGDGLGKSLSSPLPSGTFGGGLHGADPRMAPFASAASRFGLQVTSGKDDHDKMTNAGYPSYHGSGEALDFSNGYETPEEMAFARQMVSKYGGSLAELIYTPLGFSIKNGKKVAPIAAADHHDHVHLAFDLGKPGVGIGDGIGRAAAFTGDGPGYTAMTQGWKDGPARPLSHNQVAALAESVGLPGETFAQIAKGESGYDPDNIGHDPGGTVGLGLWQITTKYNDDIIRRFGGPKAILDPNTNARAAKAVWDRQGKGAWNGTRFVKGWNLHYKGSLTGVGGSKAKPKSGSKGAGSTASGGYSSAKDAPDSPTYGGEGAADPLGTSDGGTMGRVTAARVPGRGGPSKGFPVGFTPADPVDAPVGPSIDDFATARVARARLTEGTEDDLAALENLLSLRKEQMDAALSDSDPRNDSEAIDAFLAVKDSLDQLKGSVDTANQIQQQRDQLNQQIADNQLKILALVNQGPQIVAAVVAAVSGGIGGQIGLGMQTPSYAGGVARYGVGGL